MQSNQRCQHHLSHNLINDCLTISLIDCCLYFYQPITTMKVSPITLSFAILGHARANPHLCQEGHGLESSTAIENKIDMCIADVSGAACIAEYSIQSNDAATCLGVCTALSFPSTSTDGIDGSMNLLDAYHSRCIRPRTCNHDSGPSFRRSLSIHQQQPPIRLYSKLTWFATGNARGI